MKKCNILYLIYLVLHRLLMNTKCDLFRISWSKISYPFSIQCYLLMNLNNLNIKTIFDTYMSWRDLRIYQCPPTANTDHPNIGEWRIVWFRRWLILFLSLCFCHLAFKYFGFYFLFFFGNAHCYLPQPNVVETLFNWAIHSTCVPVMWNPQFL